MAEAAILVSDHAAQLEVPAVWEHVKGTLNAPAEYMGAFAGIRVEASFSRRMLAASRPLTEVLADTPEQAEAPGLEVGGRAAAMERILPERTVTAQVSALVGEDGSFDLVLPDQQLIVGPVRILALAPTGVTLGKQVEVDKGNLGKHLDIAVDPPALLVLPTPDAPAKQPPTRRIQGRVIERHGQALPASMQILLLAQEKGAKDDDPFKPILVARTDVSGYFAGSVRNHEFSKVVALISGVPDEVPVALEESLVPPRIPIVIDLDNSIQHNGDNSPGGGGPSGSTTDCGCGAPGDVPRTPTQENIADAPGQYSVDLGTGGCVKFTVPNRAIEEYSFYSVVRTTEPRIARVSTAVETDPAVVVIIDQPRVPDPTPTGPDRATLEVLLRAALLGIEARALSSMSAVLGLVTGTVSAQDNRWKEIEATVRDILARAGARSLPRNFFTELRKDEQFIANYNFGGTTDLMRSQTEAVIRAVATAAGRYGTNASGSGVLPPPPPPGVAVGQALAAVAQASDGGASGQSPHTSSLDIYWQRGLPPRAPGRVPLDESTPVDWDETPTIYEATTIAHGHLLHYKQIWYADGYSLGNLLNSIALAPGQKKLIAVVDWERRETTTRSEVTSADEGLQASLARDRDLSEVVAGALQESLRGGSHNTTSGVGAGTGAAGNGTYMGANFGGLIGVSGGSASSDSNAFQHSGRGVAASTLQTIRDQTVQSATAVRTLHSTVVQTVAQGETVRASTEVVANHNHCHALTIEYFEVLRHLKVTNELVDVQECLFVPLPMTDFNRAKTLRWRQALAQYLTRRELTPGFDATRRVSNNWADVDTPRARYARRADQRGVRRDDSDSLHSAAAVPREAAGGPGERSRHSGEGRQVTVPH